MTGKNKPKHAKKRAHKPKHSKHKSPVKLTPKRSSGKHLAKKRMIPGLGRVLGGAVGGLFGDTGRSIGESAGDLFGKITGMGSYRYHVSKNAMLQHYNAMGVPNFGPGTTVIKHSEYLMDVQGSTSFTRTDFALNPGQIATFPWLSQIAQRYEEYEFLGLVFEYRGTSAVAVNSTNTALGQVVMSTMYNSAEPTFVNKQQMEAYEFTVSCSPAQTVIHPVECAPSQQLFKKHLVRDQVVPADSDINTYDWGRFSIATVGMQAAANIGELWVTYKVRLLKPKLENTSGSGNWYSVDYVAGSSGNLVSAAVLNDAPGYSFTNNSATPNVMTVTLPPQAGYYLVLAIGQSNGSTFSAISGFSGSSAVTVNPAGSFLQSNTEGSWTNHHANGTGQADFMFAYIITVSGDITASNNPTLAYTFPTTATAAQSGSFTIVELVNPTPSSVSVSSRIEQLETMLARLTRLRRTDIRLGMVPDPTPVVSDDDVCSSKDEVLVDGESKIAERICTYFRQQDAYAYATWDEPLQDYIYDPPLRGRIPDGVTVPTNIRDYHPAWIGGNRPSNRQAPVKIAPHTKFYGTSIIKNFAVPAAQKRK